MLFSPQACRILNFLARLLKNTTQLTSSPGVKTMPGKLPSPGRIFTIGDVSLTVNSATARKDDLGILRPQFLVSEDNSEGLSQPSPELFRWGEDNSTCFKLFHSSKPMKDPARDGAFVRPAFRTMRWDALVDSAQYIGISSKTKVWQLRDFLFAIWEFDKLEVPVHSSEVELWAAGWDWGDYDSQVYYRQNKETEHRWPMVPLTKPPGMGLDRRNTVGSLLDITLAGKPWTFILRVPGLFSSHDVYYPQYRAPTSLQMGKPGTLLGERKAFLHKQLQAPLFEQVAYGSSVLRRAFSYTWKEEAGPKLSFADFRNACVEVLLSYEENHFSPGVLEDLFSNAWIFHIDMTEDEIPLVPLDRVISDSPNEYVVSKILHQVGPDGTPSWLDIFEDFRVPSLEDAFVSFVKHDKEMKDVLASASMDTQQPQADVAPQRRRMYFCFVEGLERLRAPAIKRLLQQMNFFTESGIRGIVCVQAKDTKEVREAFMGHSAYFSVPLYELCPDTGETEWGYYSKWFKADSQRKYSDYYTADGQPRSDAGLVQVEGE
ncbi:hypothetical protein BJ508DRAFT_101429 [Ascobolus immersus RN42]|uniref:Uncharacterized protein n=1 Tax=Ascobolus immersus RN42 TaxID=1160509 RepID=A0A3N4IKH8_ASCIM|nr:hypothetical protein BJ508DRAFT_101429 [Ascobolus immersus RN42]